MARFDFGGWFFGGDVTPEVKARIPAGDCVVDRRECRVSVVCRPQGTYDHRGDSVYECRDGTLFASRYEIVDGQATCVALVPI